MKAWLDEALDYIPSWLDYQMRQSEQPGCVIAVAYKGRIVLERAFGHADAVRKTRLTPRHRFRVASHSKTFTAAGLLKLREAGRVRLDDPVGEYVSGLYPDIARTTIGQLLSHGGGIIRDGTDTGQWQDRRAFLQADELRAALAEPPVLEASMRFKYSNHGFALLGLAIEAVTGQSFGEFITSEILKPSKLRNTRPDAPLEKGKPFASGHSGKVLLGRRVIVPGTNVTSAMAPATGVVSTAADLARFYASLDPDAKTCVLSKASRREMLRRHWHDDHSSVDAWYGLGVMSGQVGDWDWAGHTGGFQGFATRTVLLPGRDLSISVLTNAVDGMASVWCDGAIQILRNFANRGAASDTTRKWKGRWWGLWGCVDLVAMSDHVAVAVPAALNPFANATEIKVAGDNAGWIHKSSGFGSPGEGVSLTRGRTGRLREIRVAGTRLLPEAQAAKLLRQTYED